MDWLNAEIDEQKFSSISVLPGRLMRAKLILAKEDVMTISSALELALFMDAKLDVSKVAGKNESPSVSRGFQEQAHRFGLGRNVA